MPSIFFLTITESLSLHKMGKVDTFPVKLPGIKFIPTTETEIKTKIHSLKQKISSGNDEISKILKACSALISFPNL
jgi:hypothetical protein